MFYFEINYIQQVTGLKAGLGCHVAWQSKSSFEELDDGICEKKSVNGNK